ncbi:CvpA family protein [Nitrosococcus oceani]|uniref:Colicin V production protein n=2 Tax=Nitrosococcus oceani TaxID=1229 RepID=Q3JAK2_NITOC|nr:CvpA family protein [Nitrosococcus oceani]KFI19475.1 colicin V production CvpA [Nitrosococcus oceani C-27]ABA58144.1 Colicin V production protein [Nitrosococcus oceani ATCC 19707]EDZ67859.1 CvpA family protein [Nitrosococcus oceani AFC27]KFI22720.1 colicin V production CvpA [Nitrosococcus oceani]GEM21318.1 colicin V production protein CvpA [Nitrosococcus oceani]
MIWVDYIIIGIIFLSGLFSLARGFFKETLSLIAWVMAFWIGLNFSPQTAEWLADLIMVPPSLRLAIAFLLLLLATLLLAAIVNYLIVKLVHTTGLTGTDRIFGLAFGIVRGVAIITVLVILAGMTPMPQDPWWRNSQLLNYFQGLALWVRSFMPPDIAGHIQF